MAYLDEADDDDEGAALDAPQAAATGALSESGKAQLRGALATQQKSAAKLGVTYEDLTRQRQEKVQQQRSIIDGTIQKLMSARQSDGVIPLLAAASGFLSPTRTGGTGESIGNALRNLTPALAQEDQQRQALALQTGQLQSQGAGLESGMLREQQQDALRRMLAGEKTGASLSRALARAEQGQALPSLVKLAQYIHPDDMNAQRTFIAKHAPNQGGTGGEGVPPMLIKLMARRDRLPEGHPDRVAIQAQIEALSTNRGQISPSQQARMDAQTERHIDKLVKDDMTALEREGRFNTPEDRADAQEGVRARIMARYNRGAIKVPGPQTMPVAAEAAPPPVAGATPAAPMPNVTITPEAPTGPAPIASPTPSAQKPGPGYSLRLPSGEEGKQRDELVGTGIAIQTIDDITEKLQAETGLSSTTGIGGLAQRGYNNSFGQLFGNWDKTDAQTMSNMAALVPLLNRALKPDSNLSKAEREDLQRIVSTWDALKSRDTILTDLGTIKKILGKRADAARARLGPRANEPVAPPEEKKRLRYNPSTGKLE